MSVLVLGECGVGKSTLIKECTGEDVQCGKDAGGVTKKVTSHAFNKAYGTDLSLVDVPGVGDEDVPFNVVLDMVAEQYPSRNFVAVVIVVSGLNPRMTHGLQCLSKLLGFVFRDSLDWHENVVLVATHWDRVELSKTDDLVAQMKNSVQQIADKISQKAQIQPIPLEQRLYKRGGQDQDIREVARCLRIIQERHMVKFAVPIVEQQMEALATLLPGVSPEEMKKEQERHNWKRQQECLKRMQVAVESARADLLEYILSTLEVIFETEEEKQQLAPYVKIAEEWREQCQSTFWEICRLSQKQPPDLKRIAELASDGPCRYDVDIQLFAHEVSWNKNNEALTLALQESESRRKVAESLGNSLDSKVKKLEDSRMRPFHAVVRAVVAKLQENPDYAMRPGDLFQQLYKEMPVSSSVVTEAGGAKQFCIASGCLMYVVKLDGHLVTLKQD